MKDYVVEVWEFVPENERTREEIEWRIDHRVTRTMEFNDILAAWQWVLDNKIECYTVFKTVCVIDNS